MLDIIITAFGVFFIFILVLGFNKQMMQRHAQKQAKANKKAKDESIN